MAENEESKVQENIQEDVSENKVKEQKVEKKDAAKVISSEKKMPIENIDKHKPEITNKIIYYPLSTEKAIRLMESENKLVFVVERTAKKVEIKQAIEEEFKVKVTKVNTLIATDGRKHAYVTFDAESPAIDIATNLGMM